RAARLASRSRTTSSVTSESFVRLPHVTVAQSTLGAAATRASKSSDSLESGSIRGELWSRVKSGTCRGPQPWLFGRRPEWKWRTERDEISEKRRLRTSIDSGIGKRKEQVQYRASRME